MDNKQVIKNINESQNSGSHDEYFESVVYSSPRAPATKRYADAKISHIEQFAPLDKSMSVLDVGCGNGVFSVPLSNKAGWVVGTDYSAHMLRLNEINDKARCDASKLCFRDKSFHMVFEANLLHHIQATDREKVVSEMMRVSKTHVVFIEPNILNPLMLAFGSLVKEERGSLVFTAGYLRGLLEKCGVKVDAVFCTGMITQNRTPSFLIPLLGMFDIKFPLGEYIVAVGKK